ncbi:MAG: HAMP domain-containing protein [Candidatus Thiodiazotropha sp. (ex Lucinoma kastoroae)]|nr:HAMP domain-containing protein [Candidatus Thiodiazotropha sp. (ex Lucinoma kastoroae)]MCU7861919.1 HAMP domain-containing protein [Candidatus Thiodiazotropha sp. (ex Lucinoma kastoroae)]
MINISAIQESSSKVTETLINFQNRQADILAARSSQTFEDIDDKSKLIKKYSMAVKILNQSFENDDQLKQLIQKLEQQFQDFKATDDQIYSNVSDFLSAKEKLEDLSSIIDQQLNDLDTAIGNISGKLTFRAKRVKRRIKRLLKKEQVIYYDTALVDDMVSKVKAVVLGKEANLIEHINKIQADSLKLSAHVRQLLSTTSRDTALNLRKNKINQRIDNIRSLIGSMTESIQSDSELLVAVSNISELLELFLSTSFLSEYSIYEVQIKQIDVRKQQNLLIQSAAGHTAALNETINKLSYSVLQSRQKIAEQSGQQVQSSNVLIIGITLGVFLLLVSLTAYIARSINKPLSEVASALYDIAEGEGDLTQRLKTGHIREIARIAEQFNLFVEKVATTIRHVDEASGNLFAASSTLDQVSTQTKTDIMEQKDETANASSAMTEMTRAAKGIAQNSDNARLASQEVRDESENSNKIVTGVASDISRLAKQIGQTADAILELEQFSVSIGKVLDVIRSIAEQTNLLALNAAIEAARAGEQGRGFAVVADEVRSLASRTQESTVEIEEMIKQLQSSAQNAVGAIKLGHASADKSVDQANRAAASLSKITESITRISEMNTAIASAAEQQSAVSEEINSNVEQIGEIGNRTVQGADDIAKSGQNLSELSAQLQHLMTQFKV